MRVSSLFLVLQNLVLHIRIVKVMSVIAVQISAECAVDKSGKLNRYGGDSAAEGLSVFRSYAIYTIQ